MKLIEKIKYGAAVSTGALFMLASRVQAEVVGPPAPGSYPQRSITLETLRDIVRTIERFLITVGFSVAAIFIIWGGITYMFAGGNSEKATTAKTRLFNGIIGAIVVIGAYVILRTISALLSGGLETF